jgi:hypothetical protein
MQECRALVDAAIKRIPQLTVYGVGVWSGCKGDVAQRIAAEQAQLYEEPTLAMVAACARWIKGRELRRAFNPHLNSYVCKHTVENGRRAIGDPDPYTYNGAFIAAAVGLGLAFKVDGPNVIFKFSENRRALRQRIDTALCADGQRLRGNSIVQIYEEVGPMMLPCRPHVVQQDVDVETLGYKLGVL